jgi:hypothetical protein
MIAVSESLHSPVSARRHSFAYLFERFPSFVQTFVYREAIEMVRQEMAPWLVSIRRPDDPDELTEPVEAEVFHLPEADAIGRRSTGRSRSKNCRRGFGARSRSGASGPTRIASLKRSGS